MANKNFHTERELEELRDEYVRLVAAFTDLQAKYAKLLEETKASKPKRGRKPKKKKNVAKGA
jgi:hypothetical protein